MQRRHVCETAGMSGQWFPYPRAGMVRWYSPLQLAATGSRVTFSTLLGGEFDRRQIDPRTAETYTHFDLSVRTDETGAVVPRDEIVVDYIADTGDGWNSTYAVAHAATRPSLAVRDPTGATHTLRRGELLIFGGDEVYPTPTRAANNWPKLPARPQRAVIRLQRPREAARMLRRLERSASQARGMATIT